MCGSLITAAAQEEMPATASASASTTSTGGPQPLDCSRTAHRCTACAGAPLPPPTVWRVTVDSGLLAQAPAAAKGPILFYTGNESPVRNLCAALVSPTALRLPAALRVPLEGRGNVLVEWKGMWKGSRRTTKGSRTAS